MRKLWIVPAILVTASMASGAYGGSVTVAPVTQVTVAPVTQVSPVTQVTVGNQVTVGHSTAVNINNQVATGVATIVETPTSIALKGGNANATANAVTTLTVINNNSNIKFGTSSTIGQ